MLVFFRHLREAREAARRPADPTESLPMFLTSAPEPELIWRRRQSRVVLLALTWAALTLYCWMPAILIFESWPNLFVSAAHRYGWPRSIAAGFTVAGLLLLPFMWVQYRDPLGPLRLCTSRLAQLGMLIAAIDWLLLSIGSLRLDNGLFTGVSIALMIHSGYFAYAVADSTNNELRIAEARWRDGSQREDASLRGGGF